MNENSNRRTKSPQCVKLPFLFVHLLPMLVMLAEFWGLHCPPLLLLRTSKRDFNYSFIMLQNQELCEETVELCIWQDNFLTQFHKVWLFLYILSSNWISTVSPPDCFLISLFFISSAYQYVCHEEEQSLQLRCAVLFWPGLEWLLLVYSGGLPVHLCPM